MIEKKFTAIDENELYLNIKMNWRLNSKQLNTLKYLASWRYLQAKKRDLPIGFVAKDNTLMALAQSNPASTSAMLSLEGAEALDVRHKGKAMLSVLAQANKTPESEYPAKVSRLDEYPGYKQTFKKVKAFLVELSEKNGLAIENVASKKQINQFLTWQYKLNGPGSNIDNVDLLANWRAPLFGQPLIEFAQNGYK
jgi:ribonuclease D